jgi:hypothetical protein
MPGRAFPVIYSRDVESAVLFYQRLGFQAHFRLPPAEGEAGYVGLRRGDNDLGIVSADWPQQQLGVHIGTGARFGGARWMRSCIEQEEKRALLRERWRAGGRLAVAGSLLIGVREPDQLTFAPRAAEQLHADW